MRNIWDIKPNKRAVHKALELYVASGRWEEETVLNVGMYLNAIWGLSKKRFYNLWRRVEQVFINQGLLDKGGVMMTFKQQLEAEIREKVIKKERRIWEQQRPKIKMEGIRKGEKKGLQIGKKEGKIEKTQQVVRNMLSKGLDITLIAEITGLNRKGIAKLKKLKNGSAK